MVDLVKDLIREIREDGLFDTAAGVAFWLLLSLPAALLAGLSSVSFLGEDLTSELRTAVLDFIEQVFTDESGVLRASVDDIFDNASPGVFSLSLAVSVFTVSRGFAGLIRSLDIVYDVEETRNFAHTRLLGIGLAVGTLATVAASTALWAWSGSVGAPGALRVGGALVVLIVWAATMLHIGPNLHTPWRYDLPGAAFAAVGWFLVSAGFRWYVEIAGGGNSLLGAAGALLFALTWLWVVCVLFLVGGELNELLAERAGVVRDPVTVVGRLRHLRTLVADDGAIADDATDDDDTADTDTDTADTDTDATDVADTVSDDDPAATGRGGRRPGDGDHG